MQFPDRARAENRWVDADHAAGIPGPPERYSVPERGHGCARGVRAGPRRARARPRDRRRHHDGVGARPPTRRVGDRVRLLGGDAGGSASPVRRGRCRPGRRARPGRAVAALLGRVRSRRQQLRHPPPFRRPQGRAVRRGVRAAAPRAGPSSTSSTSRRRRRSCTRTSSPCSGSRSPTTTRRTSSRPWRTSWSGCGPRASSRSTVTGNGGSSRCSAAPVPDRLRTGHGGRRQKVGRRVADSGLKFFERRCRYLRHTTPALGGTRWTTTTS